MFIYLWLGHAACRLLVPWSGIEPELPAVEVQSLSHCTTALCNRHSIFTDHEKVWSQATCPQSFFYHPMDCSLPGSSVHGICQAGILDWGAISFSRGSSWPRDQTRVSSLEADALTSEPPGKIWYLKDWLNRKSLNSYAGILWTLVSCYSEESWSQSQYFPL